MTIEEKKGSQVCMVKAGQKVTVTETDTLGTRTEEMKGSVIASDSEGIKIELEERGTIKIRIIK